MLKLKFKSANIIIFQDDLHPEEYLIKHMFQKGVDILRPVSTDTWILERLDETGVPVKYMRVRTSSFIVWRAHAFAKSTVKAVLALLFEKTGCEGCINYICRINQGRW